MNPVHGSPLESLRTAQIHMDSMTASQSYKATESQGHNAHMTSFAHASNELSFSSVQSCAYRSISVFLCFICSIPFGLGKAVNMFSPFTSEDGWRQIYVQPQSLTAQNNCKGSRCSLPALSF